MRTYLLWGSVLALLGVALGAFGAHALKDRLTEDMLAIYHTGVQYQMYHALGLLGIALLHDRLEAKKLVARAGLLLVIGVIIFSGSLYLLALSGIKVLGAITPIGGVAFIAGWACLAAAAWKERRL
ncbi:DUF423 domain-containing protein [Paenibacillus aurantius]|uniref:DUF423 domain-containing protein n=1 Tax=Paenibacillus aurantius TaxID=2918900 RepID=A0AA96RC26_9BACL|nr:DUF423 domain-containing protein [Paenibacillus aurantius]WJH34843.1 DUF423 domain-containing protein [Paenibacillus sp. CC-CFT747]WNQ10075.1 DUF423 domain-containing protein [Paenibacillus aurantius]